MLKLIYTPCILNDTFFYKGVYMSNSRLIVLCFFLFLQNMLTAANPAPHIIEFFFKPKIQDSALTTPAHTQESLNQFLSTPGKMNRALLRKQLESSHIIQGIYVLYSGLVTHSDANGQVTFPRRQVEETVTLVVTNGIVPVFLFGNTIHHLEVRENAPADFYTLTRTHDEKSKQSTWNVTKIQPPAKNKIPDQAIIIIAKPKQIDMMEGISITGSSANFILPDVYVKGEITLPTNVLSLLKYNKFFSPVLKSFVYTPDRYASQIINSL